MASYEQLSLDVDPEVEKVYIKLLRKQLEHPENWCVYNNWNDQYCSPEINDNGVYFVTVGKSTTAINVYHKHGSSNENLHEIKIPFWDFKTPKMLGNLFSFMPHKKTWEQSQKTTKSLKELLGIEFDRYAKIMKIKKKIE